MPRLAARSGEFRMMVFMLCLEKTRPSLGHPSDSGGVGEEVTARPRVASREHKINLQQIYAVRSHKTRNIINDKAALGHKLYNARG